MCRTIHTLHNFEPTANDHEMHAAALRYVRRINGTTKLSTANTEVVDRAIEEITQVTRHLLNDRAGAGPPKVRRAEAEKAEAKKVEAKSAKPPRHRRRGSTSAVGR